MIFLGGLGESGEITVIREKHVNTFAVTSWLFSWGFSQYLIISTFQLMSRKQEKSLLLGIVQISCFFISEIQTRCWFPRKPSNLGDSVNRPFIPYWSVSRNLCCLFHEPSGRMTHLPLLNGEWKEIGKNL